MKNQNLNALVGKNLQAERMKRKITQEQIAEAVEISTSFYANIERGNKGVSFPVLCRITEYLGISLDSLIREKDEVDHLENIRVLLNGQPESFIMSMERMIRVFLEEFSEKTE